MLGRQPQLAAAKPAPLPVDPGPQPSRKLKVHTCVSFSHEKCLLSRVMQPWQLSRCGSLSARDLCALPQSRLAAPLQSFFWDKIPDGRVAGTFWDLHPADYGLLAPCAQQAEELFQVPRTHPAAPHRARRVMV